jgi:hypothetical protein
MNNQKIIPLSWLIAAVAVVTILFNGIALALA